MRLCIGTFQELLAKPKNKTSRQDFRLISADARWVANIEVRFANVVNNSRLARGNLEAIMEQRQ
jgi:hypothetical protein